MWAKLRSSDMNKDGNQATDTCRSLNVNEEYLCALRTKSYADFFNKAQVLVNEPTSPCHCHHKFSEVLLDPGQETIATILQSTLLSKKSDLKALILDYFEISAEASKVCSHLLTIINQIHVNYAFVKDAIRRIDQSPQEFGLIHSEFLSFISLKNPFSNLNKQDFKVIIGRYSSVLDHLKLKKKKLARKIKLISYFNKASGVCVTAACGLVAMAAVVVAAHTLTALVMGPAIFSLPIKPLRKKLLNFRLMGSGFLRKVGEQLDVATKGTYILNRDFDTMSRLVDRLHGEVEHNRGMVQLCLERREDRFSLQVLKELRKSDVGFRKQVEELEEHVYLCLVTINRARALVMKEIAKSCEDQKP